MSDGIINRTAIELGTLLADGQVSSVEIMRAHIDRTRTVDDAVGAFIS